MARRSAAARTRTRTLCRRLQRLVSLCRPRSSRRLRLWWGVVSGEAAKEAQEGGGVWGQQRRRASSEAKAEHWLASLDYNGLTDSRIRSAGPLQSCRKKCSAWEPFAQRPGA